MIYKDGQYSELDWYDSSPDIDWMKNNFSSDPNEVYEMYFISKISFFTGELGTLPVFAFKCPQAGKAELSFLTHGQSDMRLTVYKGDALVQVEGRDAVIFDTDGHTPHSATIEVSRGDMIYMVGSTLGNNREGWVSEYSVSYISAAGGPGSTGSPKTGDFAIITAAFASLLSGAILLYNRKK